MLMSALEVTWRSIFARIVDATSIYDEALLKLLRDANLTESVLAHRGEVATGAIVATGLGVWQSSDQVNYRFQSLLSRQPISHSDRPLLADYWQVRHIIAHGAGVTTSLDEYRLGGRLPINRALQIDPAYLGTVEVDLVRVVTAGVRVIGDKLLGDFFASNPTYAETSDRFATLYLLANVFPHTTELPAVTEAVFDQEHQRLTQPGAHVQVVGAVPGQAAAAVGPHIP